ncbi:MAG: DUF4135 domain-containing protein [Coriobacteriaceae bacterium]|nr:DUF4135 domain-containing protein [Coriobacteriaceae bacterium]MDD6769184.1 DUF4135 domain-containing protein [Coriobacteriaceae bacterium]
MARQRDRESFDKPGVELVEGEDGARWVRKDRSMCFERAFFTCMEDVLGHEAAPAPRFCGELMEFIEERRPESGDEAELLWRNAGMQAALFWVLCSTDLKAGNLVARGSQLYCIDAEFAIVQMPPMALIVPWARAALDDYLRQRCPSYQALVTLAGLLDYLEGQLPPAEGAARRNLLAACRGALLEGFGEGLQRCLQGRGRIVRFLEEARSMGIRVIMHPFELTMRQLESVEPDEHVAFLEESYRRAGLGEYAFLAQLELDSRLGTNPRFTALGGSHDLMFGGELVARGCFPRSAVDQALDRLRQLTPQAAESALCCMERVLARRPLPCADPVERYLMALAKGDFSAPLTAEEALEELERVFAQLDAELVREPGGVLLPAYAKGEMYVYVRELDAAARFAEGYAQATHSEHAAKLARELRAEHTELSACIEWGAVPEAFQPGGAAGEGGIATPGRREADELAAGTLKPLDALEGGNAGDVLALIAAARKHAEPRYADAALRRARAMVARRERLGSYTLGNPAEQRTPVLAGPRGLLGVGLCLLECLKLL